MIQNANLNTNFKGRGYSLELTGNQLSPKNFDGINQTRFIDGLRDSIQGLKHEGKSSLKISPSGVKLERGEDVDVFRNNETGKLITVKYRPVLGETEIKEVKANQITSVSVNDDENSPLKEKVQALVSALFGNKE